MESLAPDNGDPQVVYAAAGNGDPARGEKTDLLTPADQDHHLTALRRNLYMLGNGAFRTGGERPVVDSNRSAAVYFGSRRQGLWKPDNGGAT